jgi:hypothetical protein
MTILAHLTAGGTAAFAIPMLIVMVVLIRRSGDQSARAEARRRRSLARRATIREYWTLERRGDSWVVVEARQDVDPDLEAPAPSPWAEMPGGNGNGKAKHHEVRDLIAGMAQAHHD